MNLYNPYSGVTNNQSESFNAALKWLQRWREVPVDSILLTLYHLQAYFHNKIQRDFAGRLCKLVLIYVNIIVSYD